MSAILDRADTDGHLIRRARAGDTPAFDELYRRYRPRLAAYGASILGDREAGEDVAQVALFNAYRALQRGTQPVNLQAWLFRIARNTAYEVARRRRDVLLTEDPDEACHDVQEASAIRGALIDGLRGLPDRQRATFALRELHGYSTAEVADRLDLTISQVEQALFAARNRLAEQLVLGERADCDSFRGVDPRSLDHAERRVLKAHARTCSACRSSSGARRVLGLTVLPIGVLASAREAGAMLLGGIGAPAAVKVGAAVVTAAVATSVPVTMQAVKDPSPSHAASARAASAPATADPRPEQSAVPPANQGDQPGSDGPQDVSPSAADVAAGAGAEEAAAEAAGEAGATAEGEPADATGDVAEAEATSDTDAGQPPPEEQPSEPAPSPAAGDPEAQPVEPVPDGGDAVPETAPCDPACDPQVPPEQQA